LANRRQYRLAAINGSTSGEGVDLSIWPTIDEGGLTPDRLEKFLSRKRAVELYLGGRGAAEIKAETGLSRLHVYRLVRERCLETNEDGQLNGWRGLIPHLRVNPYIRRKALSPDRWGRGTAGALQLLFSSLKGRELELRFNKKILQSGRVRRLAGKRIPQQDLIVWFLNEVRSMYPKDADSHWPFNVAKQGQITISKYINKVLDGASERGSAIRGGPEAAKKGKAGDGTDRPPRYVFTRVEGDAHKTDIRCVINVPNHSGGYEPILVHRIWVVVLVEVESRCVLGYTISVRREVSADDVLRAIRSALSKWQPKKLSFTDQGYCAGAGLPSHLGNEFVGLCWDEFSVDGALANVCKRVKNNLTSVVKAKLLEPGDPHSFSSRRSLDDRPYIETFFRNLRKLHKLSPSTGSKPDERKGRDPEKEAELSNFQLEYLEELLDVIVANFNATPHSSLGYRSPLKQMEFLCKRPGTVLRYADEGEVRRLVCPRKLCMVHAIGQGKTGAYVNFSNARYSAEWLRGRLELVGQYVWIFLENDFDARFATASSQSGVMLGTLKALPPWHTSPHTLYMRSAIRSLDARKIIHISSYTDPIEQLIEFAENGEDRKLATHPAYLEARQVFQAFAAQFEGASSPKEGGDDVASPDAELPPPQSATSPYSEVKPAKPLTSTVSPSAKKSVLPPRRKAINSGDQFD
jgi:transposase InsO family protein